MPISIYFGRAWALAWAVSAALAAVEPPVVNVNSPTVDSTPTWTWSGSGGGNGTFRWQLDNPFFPGAGTTGTQTSFTPARPLRPQGAVSCYFERSYAVLTDGSVRGWGNNNFDIPANPSPVVSVSGPLALRADGTVVGWPGQAMSDVTAVDMAGYYFSLALRANGTVTIATGFASGVSTAAQAVPEGLSEVVAIAAGNVHMAVVRANGSVVAWGENDFGQISVPSSLSEVVALDAGINHTVALRNSGALDAWGDNRFGQTDVPVGLADVVAVAAGAFHTLALRQDGTVVAWGRNDQGQCTVPAGLTQVVAIAGGESHSLALRANGTLVTWGKVNQWGYHTPATIPVGVKADATARATLYVQEHDGTAWSAAGKRTVTLLPELRLTSPAYAGFELGSFGSFQVTANVPCSISCTGLPSGLSMSGNGNISGTVTTAGEHVVAVAATVDGVTVNGTLTVRVAGFGQLVTPLYEQALGRTPDTNGYAYWLGRGMSGGEIAHEFLTTPEFQNRSLSDDSFIDTLYRALLARNPDSGGRSAWLGELQRGVLREDIIYGFLQSQEFANRCASLGLAVTSSEFIRKQNVRHFVLRFYVHCLGRQPDAAGLGQWTQQLLDGAKFGRDVAYGFIYSDEFRNRNLYGGSYVTVLYRAFFNREPDAAGMVYWLGKSQTEALNGFIGADEFAILCNAYGILRFPSSG